MVPEIKMVPETEDEPLEEMQIRLRIKEHGQS
jgi:hypothetical protein